MVDEIAVKAVELEKRFGSFVAVNRVSFEVKRGEIFGFLGPNGAGKSTTIRMLCGILLPDGGEATVGGFDLATMAESIKGNIGYMSQKFSLYEDLTVEENIDFYSGIYRISPAKKAQRKDWVLEMAGLADKRHLRTSVLSGGWKQRLSLGCAILHEPPIIFLDEPTSGVDPISRRRFWDLIYSLAKEGTTIFVTTHYMEEAEFCDRIALIYHGEMIALDSPQQLKEKRSGGLLYELECKQPLKVLELIHDMAGVLEANEFGNLLHVSVTSDRTIKEMKGLLAIAGFPEIKLQPITPSLEDVFISCIEEYDNTHKQISDVKL
ncbi:MAG: putative ABC transporter ATP-binding protein YbhF [bacterium ADurb.Bin157]|nr:MAG: putative ABC transporter ATP-binding protein YbhF [bacterium ADurb.Bin157]